MSNPNTITRVTSLNRRDVSALAAQTSGPVFQPDSPGYEAEHTGFDLSIAQRPAIVVAATKPTDVVAAVRFAAARGLPVAVQATGHGITIPADDAMLINTRRANAVHVDPSRRTAWIQSGATWGQVVAAAGPHGLAPLCGAAPGVGAVSYTLGGGLGPLGRRYGFAADHVRRIGMVTADGELRQLSETEHPALFWAARGAGANFGVVTGMEIELMPVASVYGGGLFFPGGAIADVLAAVTGCLTGAPDELSLSVAVLTFPDIPVLPAALRGRFCVHVRVVYIGEPLAGERYLLPLRRLAAPLFDSLKTMPFTDIGTVHADPTGPMPTNTRSAVLDSFDDEALAVLLEHLSPGAPFMFELRHLGGALARPPAVANVVGHRDAVMNLFTSALPASGGFAAADEAQLRLLADLTPWSGGGALATFLSGAHVTSADVRAAYRPDDYQRLVALKQEWDPSNRFRFNLNIAPNGADSQ
ncbi:MAG: FAD-binding oxidoreductase [Pseudonocardiales bacterium]|nr:FAD-binding oxidoreductase [Pseudonocardiales bacterium]